MIFQVIIAIGIIISPIFINCKIILLLTLIYCRKIILAILICCRKKNIVLIFRENGQEHRINIESEENIEYAIDQYNRTNRNNSENHRMYYIGGIDIITEENRDKKIKEFIRDGMNNLNISVYSGEGNC